MNPQVEKYKRLLLSATLWLCCALPLFSQINAEQVMKIGRNTMYFEDYVLSIQYFNQAIKAKPYLAMPYFYRAVAKLNLEDFDGAEKDASAAIERNPFISDAYELRGVARQNLGKTDQAIEDYKKALETLPENKNLLFNIALAQIDSKLYDDADSTFTRLTTVYPGFDGAYMGRARLNLIRADTVAAMRDADKALELNKNSVGARLMRADILMHRGKEYKKALEDMDWAIKVRPQEPDFYVNRAYIRYMIDDYRGAMSDYDHALQLDPANNAALFNRGMLRSEVHDNNNAIDDYTKVLKLNPKDYKALYNRAYLYSQIGDCRRAINDLNKVIAAYPDFQAAHVLMYDMKTKLGDNSGAQKSINRAIALAGKKIKDFPDLKESTLSSQEQFKRKFTALKTAESTSEPIEQSFNNPDIKGTVQNRTVSLEMLPMMVITYYSSPSELKPGSDFIKEVEEINKTLQLHFLLQVTTQEPQMSNEDALQRHYSSLEEYDNYIKAHQARPVDYLGKAMDYLTLKDYASAIANLDQAISLTPDFAVAYFVRGIANSRLRGANANEEKLNLQKAIADFEQVIKLSPRMPAAYYNLGHLNAAAEDMDKALGYFTRAIELKPDFGEAYFNRGYVKLNQGDRDGAIADLSKAGEAGVIAAYNILKRIR